MPCLSSTDADAAFADLARRFAAARQAALRACVPEAPASATERELIALAIARDAAAAQKALFDNGLRLGRGYRHFHGRAVSLQQLPALLPSLSMACTDGVLQCAQNDSGLLLLRSGCAFGDLGPGACDLFREAIHGLFLGLTDGLYHSRHASVGHGGEVCVDAFHSEGSALRYGTIPADVRAHLDRITRQLRGFDSSLSIELLGINDSALHYRLSHGPHSQLNARTQFERHVRRHLPHLSVQEVSARPVMAG